MPSIVSNNNSYGETTPCSSPDSKCNNTVVQTRYSFYEAEDYNGTNEMVNSESECTSVEETDDSPQISLKAGISQESIDKLGSLKLDSLSGCTANSAESSSGEDILRNLVGTEQLGMHNKTAKTQLESVDLKGMSYSSVMATARGICSRNLSDLSLLDANNNRTEGNSSTSPNGGFGNSVSTGEHFLNTSLQDTNTNKVVGDERNSQLLSETAIPPEVEDASPIENIVKEALHLVRIRGHKRAVLLKTGNGTVEDGDTSFLSTGLAPLGESCNLSSTNDWEACEQIASYAATLSNSQAGSNNTTVPIPEIASTNASISGGAFPLPRHPQGENGQHLIPATKLDNRLLSPTVDVRKTVAGAGSEMFRLKCDNQSADALNSLGASFNSLALANPVYSQTTPNRENGNGSPVHSSEKPCLRVDTVPSLFTVVPSSPAPGKFNVPCERNNDAEVPLTDDSILSNGSVLKSDARRAALELERRWRREEEIERGVEKVLITILERANKQPTAPEAKECDNSSGWIDQIFSSFFSVQSPAYSYAGDPHMRPTRNSSRGTKDESITAGVEEPIIITTNKETLIPDHEDETLTSSLNAICDNEESTIHSSSVNECIDSELSSPKVPPDLQQPSLPAPLPHLTESQPPNNPPLDSIIGKGDATCIQPYPNSHGVIEEVESVDRETHPLLDTEDSETEVEQYDKVLGPLSKEIGGTTGVVLQCDEEHDDTYEIENTPSSPSGHAELIDPLNGPSASLSPSVIESITSAVRRGPSSDIITTSNSCEQSNDSVLQRERQEILDISDGDDHAEERPAHVLAKDLYAHLLPSLGKDTRLKGTLSSWLTEKLGRRSEFDGELQAWNDEDPNEPGYVSYSLSSAQLKSVEQEYENMLSRMKEDNQVLSEVENDIAAAEMILKETDMKKKASIASLSETKLARRKSITDLKVHSPLRRRKSKSTNPLSTNPAFPAAKAAGTGAEGELEIYHLPIIYKAHQTGFEPTKDLVLQPETVFAGKYYVQNELGSAAFSTAYRCVDLNSGKEGDDKEMYYDEVCLKVIKNTKDFFDQSLDEIKILELLRQTDCCNEHNILEMKTFFYHKEHLIIVTELLRQNLFEFGKYITENDEPRYFTRPRLCYIARQCLVALKFVHKLGLVHSDIKPENILLASYSKARVKVIDFGSSCYLSDRQSSYIQSRSYRAPEVVLGLPYDGKIDVWSLGCVIAEMYTGQVTFQNDSVTSMLSRIEAICGTFPPHMIEEGRQAGQFFTPNGLLYEKDYVDDESEHRMAQSGADGEDDSCNAQDITFTVYQPKMTTMAARLGFEPNLMKRKRRNREGEDSQNDERVLFVDFVKKLLTIDPALRPSAAEALEHPWILSGFNVSEEDLKYPPEA